MHNHPSALGRHSSHLTTKVNHRIGKDNPHQDLLVSTAIYGEAAAAGQSCFRQSLLSVSRLRQCVSHPPPGLHMQRQGKDTWRRERLCRPCTARVTKNDISALNFWGVYVSNSTSQGRKPRGRAPPADKDHKRRTSGRGRARSAAAPGERSSRGVIGTRQLRAREPTAANHPEGLCPGSPGQCRRGRGKVEGA